MKALDYESFPPLHIPTVKASEVAFYPGLQYILKESRKRISIAGFEPPSSKEIRERIVEAAEHLGFQISPVELEQLSRYLRKEFDSFGVLQSLIDDESVSDIIVCSYRKIFVQRARKNFQTDIEFAGQDIYEAFVERMLFKAGSSYSTRQPVADGMIGSQVRVHAVHKSLCEDGPYLTIRINRLRSIGRECIYSLEIAPSEICQYLVESVRNGMSIMVAGEVGTGKTTLVRALAAHIPEHQSVIVIEDTPEIRVEHPNIRYVHTREDNIEGEGRISPASIIKAGMRMAMNRIVFGEIRDSEAAEAFIDACSSGHPGISTIHSRSAPETIARLQLLLGRIQRGVSSDVIDRQIATALQIVVFLDVCPITHRRRIMEVREISGLAEGNFRSRVLCTYQVDHERVLWNMRARQSAFTDRLGNGAGYFAQQTYDA